MIAYYQGRALGEPDGPWRLTFALGRLENLSFFFSYKSYAEHPRFYGFWALGSLQVSLEHSFGTLWIGRQGLEAYSSWIWEDEVFVNVNMNLHTKSTQGWTQKRKETLFFQIVSICFLRIYQRMLFLSMER